VSNLDVTATIIDLPGAKPGLRLDGMSLVPPLPTPIDPGEARFSLKAR
jgi:arylsulfatase A-like enzyme